MNKTRNLKGQTFGKLVVLNRSSENTKAGKSRWVVCCSCGNEKEIVGSSLTSGLTKSCGCLNRDVARFINIQGTRYGKLVVLESAGSVGRHKIWKCLCDCGNVCKVSGKNLRTGHTVSCGCYRSEAVFKHGMSGTKFMKRCYEKRRREKEKDVDSKWTPLMEIALRAMFNSCVNCGSTDRLNTDHVHPLSKGYGLIPGNAVKLCKVCNSKKHVKMPDQLPLLFRQNILNAAEKFRLAWSGGF